MLAAGHVTSRWASTHGVPSGPVMRALMTSTRVSSTRRKMDEFQATGRFVVRTASFMTTLSEYVYNASDGARTSFAMARDRFGISEFASIRASLLK